MKPLMAIALLLIAGSPCAALDISLFTGFKIPPGWADGLKYTLESREICRDMLSVYPGARLKCIVRVDPNAKPLPPMS